MLLVPRIFAHNRTAHTTPLKRALCEKRPEMSGKLKSSKLVKASIVCALVGMVFICIVTFLMYLLFKYGPAISAQELQGSVYFLGLSIGSVIFTVIVSPAIVFQLSRNQRFTMVRFKVYFYICLFILSVLPFCYLAIQEKEVFHLVLVLPAFFALSLFCLPFGALWLRLAKCA